MIGYEVETQIPTIAFDGEKKLYLSWDETKELDAQPRHGRNTFTAVADTHVFQTKPFAKDARKQAVVIAGVEMASPPYKSDERVDFERECEALTSFFKSLMPKPEMGQPVKLPSCHIQFTMGIAPEKLPWVYSDIVKTGATYNIFRELDAPPGLYKSLVREAKLLTDANSVGMTAAQKGMLMHHFVFTLALLAPVEPNAAGQSGGWIQRKNRIPLMSRTDWRDVGYADIGLENSYQHWLGLIDLEPQRESIALAANKIADERNQDFWNKDPVEGITADDVLERFAFIKAGFAQAISEQAPYGSCTDAMYLGGASHCYVSIENSTYLDGVNERHCPAFEARRMVGYTKGNKIDTRLKQLFSYYADLHE